MPPTTLNSEEPVLPPRNTTLLERAWTPDASCSSPESLLVSAVDKPHYQFVLAADPLYKARRTLHKDHA